MGLKLVILLLMCLLGSTEGKSQSCDCDLFPIKMSCKKQCGTILLQRGNKAELIRTFKIREATAQAVVNDPNRKNKKTIEEFRNVLPDKGFKNLKERFEKWSTYVSQSNVYGDNVSGDKKITNYNYYKRDSIVIKNNINTERENFILPVLRGGRYCSYIDPGVEPHTNIVVVLIESVGEQGRIAYISDTTNTQKYNYEVDINPRDFGIGKKSSVFAPGDKVGIHISTPYPFLPFDIYFFNSEGTLYYQRARPTEASGCGGGTHPLSQPVKVKK